MSAYKRWRQLGGGSFYKFEIGVPLEGIWRGTESGKFGDNGIVETPDGTRHLFRVSVGLKDLLRVQDGTEVQIMALGKKQAKNGNEFQAYQVAVAEGSDVDDE